MKLHNKYDYDYQDFHIHSSARVREGGMQLFKSFCHIMK